MRVVLPPLVEHLDGGKGVTVAQVRKALGVSQTAAYMQLQRAAGHGLVRQVAATRWVAA